MDENRNNDKAPENQGENVNIGGIPNEELFVTVNEDGSVADNQQAALILAAQATANRAAAQAAMQANVEIIPPPNHNPIINVAGPAGPAPQILLHQQAGVPQLQAGLGAAAPPAPAGGQAQPTLQPPLRPGKGTSLKERKIWLLRPKLEEALAGDIEVGPGEDIGTVRAMMVEAYLEEAREKLPAHEKLTKRLSAILGEAKLARSIMDEKLDLAANGENVEINLGTANKAIQYWFNDQVPELASMFKQFPEAWYMPGEDPALDLISKARHTMEDYAQRVKRARKDAGLSASTEAGAAPAT